MASRIAIKTKNKTEMNKMSEQTKITTTPTTADDAEKMKVVVDDTIN